MMNTRKKTRGEKFGQAEKLTHRLKELVRTYSGGLGVIREFLQNADDAGASHVVFALDLQSYPTSVPSETMKIVQGPAIVCVNNRPFTEDDWKRIQEINHSGKASDPSKTGRFGVGFNSVYNYTDCPMILTNHRLGIFDPHTAIVGEATSDSPGYSYLLEDLWEDWPDLLLPFQKFGLNPGCSNFEGTIFRLPIRTKSWSEKSEISSSVFSEISFDDISAGAKSMGGCLLLFLRNVRSYEILKFSENGEREDVFAISTTNPAETNEIQKKIGDILRLPNEKLLRQIESFQEKSWSYTHSFELRTSGNVHQESWLKVQGFYAGNKGRLTKLADEMIKADSKAVPLAGAALPLHNTASPGWLYSSLPLPVRSELPVEVDGSFSLENSRQGIFQDPTAHGVGKLRYHWNEFLIEDACGKAVAELLSKFNEQNQSSDYQFWPQALAQEDSSSLIDGLKDSVYNWLTHYRCLSTGSSQRFCLPSEVQLVPSDFDSIEPPLLNEGWSLPNPKIPSSVLHCFNEVGCKFNQVKPSDVRTYFKKLEPSAKRVSGHSRKSTLKDSEWIQALLRFCLSDRQFRHMEGVPLALMSDGSLRRFDSKDSSFLFTPNPEERQLFKGLEKYFLDPTLQKLTGVKNCPNVEELNLERFIELLAEYEANKSRSSNQKRKCPSEEWLIAFYEILTVKCKSENCDQLSGGEMLSEIWLVPDSGGKCWPFSSPQTPVFISETDEDQEILKTIFDVGHPVVWSSGRLGAAIKAFKKVVNGTEIPNLDGYKLVEILFHRKSKIASSTFSPSASKAVLRYLARFFDRRSIDEQTVSKLISLPIYPFVDGSFGDLIHQKTYISSGFNPPEFSGELKLIECAYGEIEEFLERLHVPKLDLFQFTIDFLRLDFTQLTRENQFKATDWLRKNYANIKDKAEFQEKKMQFINQLGGTPWIECNDGVLRSINEIDHPALKGQLERLGIESYFPNGNLYDGDWMVFFEQVGIKRKISAERLAQAIRQIVTHPSNKVVSQLQEIANYISQNWDVLKEESVGKTNFHQFLISTPWIPSEKSCPKGYPDHLFHKRPPKFFKPSEVASSFELFASVMPISALKIQYPLARELGLISIKIDLVLQHFRNVISSLKSEQRVNSYCQNMLQEIYQFFGKCINKEFITKNQLFEEFNSQPCLFDKEGELWAPVKTFACAVPYFIGKRATVVFKNEPEETSSFLEAVGRKKESDADDFEAFFGELSREYSEKRVPDTFLKNLRKAYFKAAKLGEQDRFHCSFVLTTEGLISPAKDVVYSDVERYRAQIDRCHIEQLDSELGDRVVDAFGVKRISEVVTEQLVDYRESDKPEFQEYCEQITQKLNSRQFADGLRRLAKVDLSFDKTLKEINSLQIVPCKALATELLLEGEPLLESEGTSEFLFDPKSNVFYLKEKSPIVVRTWLTEVLKDHFLKNIETVHLSAILESDLDKVATLLDELKVRRISTDPEFDNLADAETDEIVLIKDDGLQRIKDEDFLFDEGNSLHSNEVLLRPNENPDAFVPNNPAEASAPQASQAPLPSPRTSKNQNVLARIAELRAKQNAEMEGNSQTSNSTIANNPNSKLESRDVNLDPNGAVKKPGLSSYLRSQRESKSSGEKDRKFKDRVSVYADSEPSNFNSDDFSDYKRIQKSAIQRVIEYESQHSRSAREDAGQGFYELVSSVSPETDVSRMIKVKGLAGVWGDKGISLTREQVEFGRKQGSQFWLYVVEFAEKDNFRIYPIQDPINKIDNMRFERDWKKFVENAAELASPTLRTPVIGDKISFENRNGTIIEVKVFGKIQKISVEFESDSKIEKFSLPDNRIKFN